MINYYDNFLVGVEPGEEVGIQLKEFFIEKKINKIGRSDTPKRSIIFVYRPETEIIKILKFRLNKNVIISFMPENFLYREIKKFKYEKSISIRALKAIISNSARMWVLKLISKYIITPDKTIKKCWCPTKYIYIDYSFSKSRSRKMIAGSNYGLCNNKFGYILGFTNRQNLAGLKEVKRFLTEEFDLLLSGGGVNAKEYDGMVVNFDKISDFYDSISALIVCLPFSSGVITKVSESIFNKTPVLLFGKIPLSFDVDEYKSIIKINTQVSKQQLLENVNDAIKSIDADMQKLLAHYDSQWDNLSLVIESIISEFSYRKYIQMK